MAMYYNTIESPIGKLTIATDGAYITGLHIEGDRYFNKVPTDWKHSGSHQLLKSAKSQLQEYFDGSRQKFELPLKLVGTSFQQSVWKALESIPFGKTTTYKQIAAKINNPNAVRAIGTAVGRNPICIIIPCHRVLTSDGSLGGYVAGLERKNSLLSHENVL
jgi:methylated-DNA-[protein]-cysteine S-methyltransferase